MQRDVNKYNGEGSARIMERDVRSVMVRAAREFLELDVNNSVMVRAGR